MGKAPGGLNLLSLRRQQRRAVGHGGQNQYRVAQQRIPPVGNVLRRWQAASYCAGVTAFPIEAFTHIRSQLQAIAFYRLPCACQVRIP